MRIPPLLTLALLPSLVPFATLAQVSTDTHALDALPPSPQSAPAPAQRARRQAPAHVAPKPRARPAAVAMPAVPPANPVIAPPPPVMPAHPPPPPPDVRVAANAPGDAVPIAGGWRLTFGPGIADLNLGTYHALDLTAARMRANPALTVAVTGWAPGTADDPSTPRRLSLDRALAARGILIKLGVVSERIRTVAKGMSDAGVGPLDRVDVVEAPPPGTQPQPR